MELSQTEALGFLASAIVAVSFLFRDMKLLRLLNVIGASMLTVYGLLIEAWPVVGLNSFLAVVNAVHLVLLQRSPPPGETQG